MTSRAQGLAAPALHVAIALGVLYVVWGSTYLAIRIVVETIPPILASGVRFLIAGSILYLVTGRTRRGLVRPTRRQWRDAAIIGACLLAGGNGLLTIGEVTIPSGISALIIATMPMWVAVFGRLFFGLRMTRLTAAGIGLGMVGVAILVWPAGETTRLDPFGVAVVVASPVLWSLGSLYSRGASHPDRPLVGIAMQMLCGGALLLGLSVLLGEVGGVRLSGFSVQSVEAVGYLVVVGSLVGYTAYGWLLHVAPLSLISTYAYVNPVVAMLLGAAILAEPMSPRTVLAAVVIVGAVALIVWARGRESAATAAAAAGTAGPMPEDLVEAG